MDDERRPGLIERIKRIYVERPTPFALVVMGGSAVALTVGVFIAVGVFMVGDSGASTTLAPGPMSP